MSKGKDTAAIVLVATGAVLGIPALLAVSSIWSGYVFSYLWLWFVVPLFGLPALGLAQAIGLTLVARFLTAHAAKKSEEGDFVRSISFALLFPLVGLGIGYVVKGFL